MQLFGDESVTRRSSNRPTVFKSIAQIMLIAVISIAVWEMVRPNEPTYARDTILPNAAAQRDQIIAEQKRTNAKLDDMMELIKSGHARVQLVQPRS